MAGGLGLDAVARAQDAAATPAPYALQIERCPGLPFDVDAYERALTVELQALGERPGAAPRQLIVRSPSCDEALQVSVREGEREASESLNAGDFAGVGQERALALATIEALRVLDARLHAPVAVAAPEPAVEPAVLPAPAPAPPARSFEIYAGAGTGGGLFQSLPVQVQLGAAFAVLAEVWVETEVAFGLANDRTALGDVDAWALTLSGSLEQRFWATELVEVSIGVGLRGGFARGRTNPEYPLTSGLRVQAMSAPILLGFAEFGASFELWEGAMLGLFVEPGYGIFNARFVGPSAAEQDAPSQLADEDEPEVVLLGPGLYGGLTLGYRF